MSRRRLHFVFRGDRERFASLSLSNGYFSRARKVIFLQRNFREQAHNLTRFTSVQFYRSARVSQLTFQPSSRFRLNHLFFPSHRHDVPVIIHSQKHRKTSLNKSPNFIFKFLFDSHFLPPIFASRDNLPYA
jgi:hypothetical protein